MGNSSSSSKKKLTNFKFFVFVLIASVVIALGVAFALSDEEAVIVGLLIAVIFSVYLTLFRILKHSNDPDNRLGNWKFFFTLSIFISGILVVALMLLTEEEETIPLSIIAGVFISSIISLSRGIKYRKQMKKAEKERNEQYQDQLQQKNRQYAEELEKKNRLIRDLQNRNSELQKGQRIVNSPSSSSSSSRYQNEYQDRERERERERERDEEQKKKERLESWYQDYVTIEVNFDFHYKDSEYNQDYWERRSEEIRVSRREAMALIESGEGAIIGRMGYNRGLIRNVSYKVPYRLYDRPWNC